MSRSIRIYRVINAKDGKMYWACSYVNSNKVLHKAKTQKAILDWIRRNVGGR